ncbi:aminotransferase class I/II-fold pyridoxal phosphate-dependent enzyme [Vallitalea okinawensis]|uniref:aminotransferase class I/II-fold pyridoxal phosphate-dependent enzyme n=1 Tax=Vallitalea okinawensis TaxID=2078660 RepID=UPI000CFD7371|nr:aminotransferase class I/II-fold pyridoxal phosphate-dependent enzyme [Vallitalea okinawensis]
MNRQESTPLFTALQEVRNSHLIPYDVPGHKQGRGNQELVEYFGKALLECDVNSMKPLDYISNPTGVIKEAEELMAEAFGADYAYFLVNGTSFGVQAMIMSTCSPGDKIIIPRNVHKSAINGLILSGAIPIYVQPCVDEKLGIANGVSFENVKDCIDKHPSAKAVFIINPTYYGMVSDLKRIVDYAHKKGIAVIVDEAHGSHLGFHDKLPLSAMEVGADMSAVSLHKTGGSLTQSSALLLKEGLITHDQVKTMLNLTQTTSASYILMASLDVARKNLILQGKQRMVELIELSQYARKKINAIGGYYALDEKLIGKNGVHGMDMTKLGIKVSGIGLTGLHVYDLLRDEYNIQVEFGDTHNILAILSLGDYEDHIEELIKALKDIKKRYASDHIIGTKINLINPKVVVSPRNAFYSHTVAVPIENAVGKISGESVMTYPPGIPIVSPGERIELEMVEYLQFLKKEKTLITGLADPNIEYINILA